jgi:hypothetical protein
MQGPEYLPEQTQQAWRNLSSSTEPESVAFDPGMTDALPAPVARWLRHCIAPGTVLRRGVQIAMHGHIRIGKWLPFKAEQIVAPSGYIWGAKAGRFPISFRGFDRYSAATGQMSWRLFGRFPLVATDGADITRSSAGRLASEVFGLTPAGALAPNVSWEGIDDRTAVGTITIDSITHCVTIQVSATGSLEMLTLLRWANPDKTQFKFHTRPTSSSGHATLCL